MRRIGEGSQTERVPVHEVVMYEVVVHEVVVYEGNLCCCAVLKENQYISLRSVGGQEA
jgi:hypothetical protein